MSQQWAYETRQRVALQIAVAALEQANAAEGNDPISAHQFRGILEQSRRIVARMDILMRDRDARLITAAGDEAKHE